MEIILTSKALKDIKYWKKQKNIFIENRIKELKNSIIESPYTGIGEPEALKYQLSGKWSRRIDKEHRFIYSIENNELVIYSLKGHYK